MGGCSVQQIMRRRFGILVRHVLIRGKYFAEVIRNGDTVVIRCPDDCLATASYLMTQKLWTILYNGTLRYPYAPCYAYLPGKDIISALGNWDREGFERDLLPQYKNDQCLEHVLEVYEANKFMANEDQTFTLYDVLVRLLLYARNHNIQVERNGVEGLPIVDHFEGLTNQGAVCIDITDAGPLLPALVHIHKEAVRTEMGDKVYLLKSVPINAYVCVGGDMHQFPTENALRDTISAEHPVSIGGEFVVGGTVDETVRAKSVEIVATILGQSGNPTTVEEQELFNYHRAVVASRTVGKNALVGLGNVAGEGTLEQCLDRVFKEVHKRLKGNLNDNDCYRLAASKLSGMNSAKMIQQRSGVLHLVNRVVCEVGEAAPNVA